MCLNRHHMVKRKIFFRKYGFYGFPTFLYVVCNLQGLENSFCYIFIFNRVISHSLFLTLFFFSFHLYPLHLHLSLSNFSCWESNKEKLIYNFVYLVFSFIENVFLPTKQSLSYCPNHGIDAMK